MKNPRLWLWVTIAVILAGVFAATRFANTGGVSSSAVQAPAQGSVQKGQVAPEFSAATDQGYFDLAKTKTPVFLEVFATWCPHCQRETAIIDQLFARYKNRVAFVAVSGSNRSIDGQGPSSEEDVLTFVRQVNAQYPVAYDGSLDVAHKYMQGGFPTLVVIDRKKIVTYAISGETPYEQLASAIDSALR